MNNDTPSLEEFADQSKTMRNLLRRAWETDLQNQKTILKKVGKLLKTLESKSPESNPSRPSVSNPAGSSVSNQSVPSVSKPVASSVSNPSGSQVSNPPDSLVFNRSRSSVLNPPNSSVSNPSGYSVSNPSRSLVFNPPNSSVSNPSRSSVFNPPDSSVSNPSGTSTSNKYRPENTDRTVCNQSVEEDVSEDEANSAYNGTAMQNVTIKLIDTKAREAVIKMIEDNLRPSVSSPSESSVSNSSSSSVSNPSGSSVSNLSGSSVSNPTGSSVSHPSGSSVLHPSGSSVSYPSGSSVSNESGPSEVEEDITADEEANSEHEGFNSSDDDEWVLIGSGKTIIHKAIYRKVNWKSYTLATRTLLLAVFTRRTLATHSLTGKKSPAFQDKPAKMCLNKTKVDDIIWEITSKFNVERSLVRSIITTKCADECKRQKGRCNS